MDHNRFDNLTRTIAGTSTRRRFSGALAALGLGSIASLRVLGADEAEAKKGKKKKGKKKVTVCHNGQTITVAKRSLKKHLGHGDTPGACPTPPPQPNCAGKECGGDGAGGSCGSCAQFQFCNNGTCEAICLPNCQGKTCGPDGCGGSCGSCGQFQFCNSGTCDVICIPNCQGVSCGPDGCGGSCGTCAAPAFCSPGGTCVSF